MINYQDKILAETHQTKLAAQAAEHYARETSEYAQSSLYYTYYHNNRR